MLKMAEQLPYSSRGDYVVQVMQVSRGSLLIKLYFLVFVTDKNTSSFTLSFLSEAITCLLKERCNLHIPYCIYHANNSLDDLGLCLLMNRGRIPHS